MQPALYPNKVGQPYLIKYLPLLFWVFGSMGGMLGSALLLESGNPALIIALVTLASVIMWRLQRHMPRGVLQRIIYRLGFTALPTTPSIHHRRLAA